MDENISSICVAVVMPVYRGAKTLAKAMESVLAQTHRNVELWVVDDGSPDDSGRIMDEFAARDKRVHPIHKPNGGCYQARLSGLQQMKCPYFAFVDQDDVAEPILIERMLKFSIKHDLDVVQCDPVGSPLIGSPEKLLLSKDDIVREIVRPILIEGRDKLTMWCKLYRNQYDFANFEPTNHITSLEDMVFNFQLYLKVSRVGFLHEGLYNYIINEGSSVRNFSLRGINDLKEGVRLRPGFLKKYGVIGEEAELINARWIVKNVRNALVTAAASPVKSWAERRRNVEIVLSLPGLNESIDVLKKHEEGSVGLRDIRVAKRIPLCLFVLFWKLVRLMRG